LRIVNSSFWTFCSQVIKQFLPINLQHHKVLVANICSPCHVFMHAFIFGESPSSMLVLLNGVK
jgi:hypothetical protein